MPGYDEHQVCCSNSRCVMLLLLVEFWLCV